MNINILTLYTFVLMKLKVIAHIWYDDSMGKRVVFMVILSLYA